MESNKIFALVLSPDAIKDIDTAFDYYEKASEGLGYEFIREIDFFSSDSEVTNVFINSV